MHSAETPLQAATSAHVLRLPQHQCKELTTSGLHKHPQQDVQPRRLLWQPPQGDCTPLGAPVQCTWAEHSLDEVSQLLRSMPVHRKLPEVMRRAFRPRGDLHGSRFSVATAAQAAAHMRHVLNAFRHTMLQMGLGSAWLQLCRTLEQASARSAADASSVDLEAVTQAHSEYLTAVFRACWLSKDQISQVCLQWHAWLAWGVAVVRTLGDLLPNSWSVWGIIQLTRIVEALHFLSQDVRVAQQLPSAHDAAAAPTLSC